MSIVDAAKRDIEAKKKKRETVSDGPTLFPCDPATPEAALPKTHQYVFHRDHVARAKTAGDLIRLALNDGEKGRSSAKFYTRLIYSDPNLLKQALSHLGEVEEETKPSLYELYLALVNNG